MFTDQYQLNLESDLYNLYDEYKDKKYNIQILYDFIEERKQHYKTKLNKELMPLVELKIINSKIVDSRNSIEHYNKLGDSRLGQNIEMLYRTIKWCKKNKLPIPNTRMFFWISDRFPWEFTNYPFFLYAKPKNIKMPIFPDNTFICLTLEKKYKGKCYDWDETKDIIKKHYIKDYNSKVNKIYFKGTATTKEKSQIRENLEKLSMSNYKQLPLKILLDAWVKYEHIYNFSKYKYLLNLPGHYPWSNRFKYLFLLKSNVINVNVITKSLDPVYEDDGYVTLIDFIVDRNDYYNIDFYYYINYGTDMSDEIKNKAHKLNQLSFLKFLKDLKDVYNMIENKNKTDKMKMINTAYKKVNNLSNERIYQYIYKCILLSSTINYI